jgi:hypothetical protein
MIGHYAFTAQFDQAARRYRQAKSLQPAASNLIADVNFTLVLAARDGGGGPRPACGRPG